MSTNHAYADHSGVSTLTGSPKEIGPQLDKLDAEQVVAVALAHASPREAGTIAEAIANIVQLVGLKFAGHEREALASLVDALVPIAPPTPTQLKEAVMLGKARAAVLEESHWLKAAQVAELAGFSKKNPSAQPNKWKREGLIFAIRHHGIDYFPGYGLDPQTGYRPLKAMAKVIEVFGETKDGWGLAYWFSSANGFLGGKRPRDLLATEPERVIAAVKDERAPVAHG